MEQNNNRSKQPHIRSVEQTQNAMHSMSGQQLQPTGIQYSSTAILNIHPEELAKNRIISGFSNEQTLAEYNILRTRVLQRLKANNWNTLAVTSSAPGAGKTLTAINLAISLAREVNHTVMLVDLDLRKPNVARSFNCAPPYGILDYWRDDVPLNEILFNPGIERLVILPGTRPVHNSSEILSSPKMVNLVHELRSRYASRIIIFDLPPVLVSDDVLAFSPYVDAMLLVIEDGQTRKDELRHTMELMSDINILGTVLNKSKDKTSPYYYYY